MKSDLDESKVELVEELNALRQQAAKADELRKRFEDIENSYKDLQSSFAERNKAFEQECFDRDRTEEALRLAEVIVDRSPVILFRRLAGEDPQLVYVSDNIQQIGYTAGDCMRGKVHFKDIVHSDDMERVIKEIEEYAEKDVEEYSQVYRILLTRQQNKLIMRHKRFW
ncbi:PAS domain-containing protein, partial [Thermodesulfobacteriota bacterium]